MGDQVKGQRLQRVAGQNGGRLVPFDVHRGQAPAQVVVIHAGQVVMHQRIGVQRLDRAGGGGGLRVHHPVQPRTFDHQKGPQALAACHGIAHRLGHGAVQPAKPVQDLANRQIRSMGHGRMKRFARQLCLKRDVKPRQREPLRQGCRRHPA